MDDRERRSSSQFKWAGAFVWGPLIRTIDVFAPLALQRELARFGWRLFALRCYRALIFALALDFLSPL